MIAKPQVIRVLVLKLTQMPMWLLIRLVLCVACLMMCGILGGRGRLKLTVTLLGADSSCILAGRAGVVRANGLAMMKLWKICVRAYVGLLSWLLTASGVDVLLLLVAVAVGMVAAVVTSVAAVSSCSVVGWMTG